MSEDVSRGGGGGGGESWGAISITGEERDWVLSPEDEDRFGWRELGEDGEVGETRRVVVELPAGRSLLSGPLRISGDGWVLRSGSAGRAEIQPIGVNGGGVDGALLKVDGSEHATIEGLSFNGKPFGVIFSAEDVRAASVVGTVVGVGLGVVLCAVIMGVRRVVVGRRRRRVLR